MCRTSRLATVAACTCHGGYTSAHSLKNLRAAISLLPRMLCNFVQQLRTASRHAVVPHSRLCGARGAASYCVLNERCLWSARSLRVKLVSSR